MTWPSLVLVLQLLFTASHGASGGAAAFPAGGALVSTLAAPADSTAVPPIIDFGPVPIGLVRDTVVRIYARNPGEIVSLRQSGGLGDRFFRILSFRPDSVSKDSIEVSVRFYPELWGYLHTSIVYTDRRQSPPDSFDLRGRGDTTLRLRYPGDTVRPTTIADTIFFRDTRINRSDTQTIVLATTRAGVTPIFHHFVGATPSGVYYLGAQSQPPDTIFLKRPDTARLPVIFSPRASGTTIDSIRLWTTNGYRIFYLKGRGLPAPAEIRVDRDSLVFLGWELCRRDSFDVINDGPGSTTFRLELIRGPGSGFEIISPRNAEIPLASGSHMMVIVEYCGSESDTGRIVVRSSNTVDSTIEISLRASQTSPLTPSQSFEFLNVRTCDTLVTTLKNNGNTDVTITDIFLLGETCGFTIIAPSRRQMVLAPAETIDLVVSFCSGCANGATSASDLLVIRGNGGDTLARIPARATVAPPSRLVFTPEPGTLLVDSGRCDTLRMSVRNTGTTSDTVTLSTLDVIRGGTLTMIDRQQGSELVLPSNGIDTILFLYCPTRAGDSVIALWTVTSGSTQPARVVIRGASPPRQGEPAEERYISIGDTVANAGELLTLSVFVAPELPKGRPAGGYRLRIGYDPRTLFPVGATNGAGGEPLSMAGSVPENGILRLAYDGGNITGGTLARIVFRGLSTGRDSNIVSLDSGAIFPNVPVRLDDGAIVRLFGCDIGRPTGLSRRATIRSLSVSGSEAILRYIAPEGSTAHLRLTSSAGLVVRMIELPAASGGEQISPVDLAGVPPGFYLFELRVGDGRSTIPLMIAR